MIQYRNVFPTVVNEMLETGSPESKYSLWKMKADLYANNMPEDEAEPSGFWRLMTQAKDWAFGDAEEDEDDLSEDDTNKKMEQLDDLMTEIEKKE